MHFEEALVGNTALASNSLQRERYVATNRFNVRTNNGPKFEKRWAERKSRLALLEGFRFFTLLRRVSDDGEEFTLNGDELGNYISLTVWEDKRHFDEWRTGEAFKEAHGGGGLGDFIQLLSTALFILKGSPKPAFYDGLLPSIGKNDIISKFSSDSGWRSIPADGQSYLPSDVFVVQTRREIFDTSSFESSLQSQNLNYNSSGGFIGSLLLRRDATKADDGWNYVEISFWNNREAYKEWKSSSTELLAIAGPSRSSTAYYEGKLALSSSKGM